MEPNYRILAYKSEDNHVIFQVHKVYYGIFGKPKKYSLFGETIRGENINELKGQIQALSQALEKPVLWAKDKFPKKYK
jgi:hypothetical protein